MFKSKSSQKGQVFILAVIVLTLLMVNTVLLIGQATTFSTSSSYSITSSQATNVAEAGIDQAVEALNRTGGTYNPSSNSQIFVGPTGYGSYTTKITSTQSGSSRLIEVTGYVPNKTNPKSQRTISLQIAKGSGISFYYALQVGDGGLSMGNNNTINGTVYSNGDIFGGNNNRFTGDVWVAGGVQPFPNQQADCLGVSCADYIFGKVNGGQSIFDVAQSFQTDPGSSVILNKVSVRIKKNGTPADITLRIMSDGGGKPSKTQLASATLQSSLVSSSYGWIDVSFASPPTLSANTVYWLMLDAAADSNTNNYWVWQNDLNQSYVRGFRPAFSPSWNVTTPVWTSFNGDLSFKTYIGGVATGITMGNGVNVVGNVHAHNITNLAINQDAFYQNLSNTTVSGTKYPNSADPPPAIFPISDINIEDWKTQAGGGTISNGNINGCNMLFGPGKIVGNIILGNSCTFTLKSPVWITGNVIVGNNSKFKLDSSASGSSGVLIVDGTTIFGNGVLLNGSGTTGSYLVYLSTFDSRDCLCNAIILGNTTSPGILYAANGQISLGNSVSFNEISAWKLAFGNDVELNYDSGLIGSFFSSGPSGSFSVVRGSYRQK